MARKEWKAMFNRMSATNDGAPVPDSSLYTHAMVLRRSREQRAIRNSRLAMGFGFACFSWAALVTIADWHMGQRYLELANQRQVYMLDRRPDGHQEVMALDNTASVSRGARWEAAKTWVAFSRRIPADEIVLGRDRTAAKARIYEPTKEKWVEMLKSDLNPHEGWTRDVINMSVMEGAYDEKNRMTSLVVTWTEKTFKDFKPMSQPMMMTQTIVMQDVNPRAGAWDGIEILDFSLPTEAPKMPPLKEQPVLGMVQN
jgi:hypothetical protein